MKIFLLTHAREFNRPSNTGSLAVENTDNMVERILWDRVNPNKCLTGLIANNEAVLLYSKQEITTAESSAVTSLAPVLLPHVNSPPVNSAPVKVGEYENIIIIDATWQEAKKIYNQSPYLKSAAHFTLKTTTKSLYKLRANQPKGGLCTIECIIEVLKIKGFNTKALELSSKFQQFNH